MSMFCFQCEQTQKGSGCTNFGVCGKSPEVALLQDMLVYEAKGIAQYAHRARGLGARDTKVDHFIMDALFSTVTNVNFDGARLDAMLKDADAIKAVAKELYERTAREKCASAEGLSGPAVWTKSVGPVDELSISKRREASGPDVLALQELLTYGLKGMAAYAHHAKILGMEDDAVYAFLHEALDLLTRKNVSADQLISMNLKCGEVNLKVMEMLDGVHTKTYGHPVPTNVRITPVKGKAILISGHDLKDLEELLKQTEGKGINIYTHGEMLPAHGYPGLKKYKHLVGNYGGAWQDQQKEFAEFPGAILMTTNCIQRPQDSYKGRIFTSGLVGWPNVVHIGSRDFSPVIKAAQDAEGFIKDGEDKNILVGFGHNAVLGVAPQVIDAVKNGKIRRFFLIGGCDGAKSGRNYYTEFAEKVPSDCVILTLACGKYRFNKLEFGNIGGIPRLLDCGQCNDAYSAIKIAGALAGAFNCSVNDLPLSLILSWYEQKAVCILLSLLHLGIKNIRLGPSLPAFVTPAILDVLVKNFNIMPIKTAEEDLKEILG